MRIASAATSSTVEAYVAFSALCQASHVFKPAAPPPLSNLVAKSPSIHSTSTNYKRTIRRCDLGSFFSISICTVVLDTSFKNDCRG